MPSEFITRIILSVLVIGGLAFRERVVEVMASLETNPNRIESDEIE